MLKKLQTMVIFLKIHFQNSIKYNFKNLNEFKVVE